MSDLYEYIDDTEFYEQWLPRLARFYRGDALNELEDKRPWLKEFSSTNPNLRIARDHFF